MHHREGKTHLVLLASASLNMINIEIINTRLSESSEFKIFCSIICISQKLCPNFVFKNSLFFFFSLSLNCLGKTPVNMVERLFKGILIIYFAVWRQLSSVSEGVILVLAVSYDSNLVFWCQGLPHLDLISPPGLEINN